MRSRFRLLSVLVLLAFAVWWLGGHWLSGRPPPPAEGAADHERVLRRGNGPEPESLDPQLARTDAASNLVRDLFEGLTTVSPDGTIIPGTAESWTVSDDGLVYTFTLRGDARWSNEDSVTSQDFLFSMRRLVDPATASPYAQSLALVENGAAIVAGQLPPDELGVSAPDDRTLVIRLHEPVGYFLELLNHVSTYPVHAESVRLQGRDFVRAGRLVSNGAYRLTDWTVGSHVTLARNPHYWDGGKTSIREVEFHHIIDQSAELMRYRAGVLDVTYSVPAEQFRWIEENLASELRIAPYLGTYFYGFNLSRPPFRDNAALRRALAMAIDRELLAERIIGRGEQPAYGWVPPGVADYSPQTPEWHGLSPSERIAAARVLYEEAGYSRDQPASLELRYNTGGEHRRLAMAVQAMWKEHLGVETTLIAEEFRVLIQSIREKNDTQIFRASWLGDYNDASNFAQVFESSFGLNTTGYHNEEYDALLAAASRERDAARRRALLEEAERLVLRDQPVIPIYFYVSKHLVKPHVEGWEDNILDYHNTRYLSFKAPSGSGTGVPFSVRMPP